MGEFRKPATRGMSVATRGVMNRLGSCNRVGMRGCLLLTLFCLLLLISRTAAGEPRTNALAGKSAPAASTDAQNETITNKVVSILSGAVPKQRMEPNPIFRFQCGASGKDCDRFHSDEGRAERGVTWQFKDPHAQGNSSSEKHARKTSGRSTDTCGDAAKVIFAESPWTKGKYSPIERGYTRKGLAYGKEEKLEVYQNTKPKKYCSDVDPALFEDPNWMTKRCNPKAPSCSEGLNLDEWTGLCANDLKGWLPEKTPPSACSFVSHKCGEKDVYYSPLKSWAFIPKTKMNRKSFAERKDLYTYKFAFKKWEVCSARQVSNSSKFTPSEKPSGLTCQVTKRCVCISCTAGPLTTEVGNEANTGEPCSCKHLPSAVSFKSKEQCSMY